jgi:hypothetical protein
MVRRTSTSVGIYLSGLSALVPGPGREAGVLSLVDATSLLPEVFAGHHSMAIVVAAHTRINPKPAVADQRLGI